MSRLKNTYLGMSIVMSTPYLGAIPTLAMKDLNYSNETGINLKSQSSSELTYSDNLPYGEFIFNILTESEKKLNEYKKEKDINLLKESIDLLCSTAKYLEHNEELPIDNDENFLNLFSWIRDEIYLLEEDEQSSLLIYYGESIFIAWRKNKLNKLFEFNFLMHGLYDYNKDKNEKAQPRLTYLYNIVIYFNKYGDLDSSSDEIPNKDNYPPKDIFGDDESNEDEEEDNKDEDNNDNNNKDEDKTEDDEDDGIVSIPNEVISSFVDYEKRGNTCVKVTNHYKNDKFLYKTESSVDKSDYVKCGIYTYVHQQFFNNSNTVIDKDYIESDQNTDSTFYIFYTINKSTKKPYYYNTGIRVSSSDKGATYNQLKDALTQLSITANGVNVSSNNKHLSVIDGSPIVLNKENKDYYSKLEIERLLNDFKNIGFKISEHIESDRPTLESFISENNLTKINIDGSRVELTKPFKIENGTLIAPLDEIIPAIGGTVSTNKNKITLSKNSKVIKATLNSNKINVGSANYDLKYDTSMISSSIYGDINTILYYLGYNLTWDYEFEEIVINKI